MRNQPPRFTTTGECVKGGRGSRSPVGDRVSTRAKPLPLIELHTKNAPGHRGRDRRACPGCLTASAGYGAEPQVLTSGQNTNILRTLNKLSNKQGNPNMNTNDKLTLQALKLKELQSTGCTGGGDVIGQFLEQDEVKAKMKNLCAYVSPALFDEVGQICELLDLSKRQVIEMAVVDFLAKAWDVIEKTGALSSAPSKDEA